MKDSLDRLTKRLESTEERVSELAYRSFEIIQLKNREQILGRKLSKFQQPHCQY